MPHLQMREPVPQKCEESLVQWPGVELLGLQGTSVRTGARNDRERVRDSFAM